MVVVVGTGSEARYVEAAPPIPGLSIVESEEVPFCESGVEVELLMCRLSSGDATAPTVSRRDTRQAV